MVPVRYLARIAPFVVLLASLTGCRVVGGIFRAGFFVAVIAILFVAALAVGLVRLIGGRHV
jgi:hypothetical protein